MYRIRFNKDYFKTPTYFARFKKFRNIIEEIQLSTDAFWSCAKIRTAENMLEEIVNHCKDESKYNGIPDRSELFEIESF